jgi:hypothetical protein
MRIFTMTTIAHNRFIDPEEQSQGPRNELHNIPEFFVDVVGDIQWRPGDGMLQTIPKVRAGVNEAIGSWALSWDDGLDSVVISLSKPDFDLYIERGDLQRVAA